MRFLVKLKLFVLVLIWSALCLGLYAVIAVGEALLEIGAGAAGAVIGQGGAAAGLADITGDAVQWGIGLLWLVGVLALWLVKRMLVSRTATGNVPSKVASHSLPRAPRPNPPGRAAGSPAARILGDLMARKARRP